MSFGYEYLNVDYYKIKCIEITGETTINPVKDKEDYPNQNIIYDF